MKNLSLYLIFFLTGHCVFAQNDSVQMYATPNPFQRFVQIHIDELDADTISLQLFDMVGQQQHSFVQGLVVSGDITFAYDGDTLPDGVYLLHLQVNNKNLATKVIKSGSIGVNELQDLARIEVFPNPSYGKFNLVFEEGEVEAFKITDTQGKLVWEQNAEQTHLTLDLSSLKAGHYLLHLQKGSAQSVRHLIRL